MILQVTDVIVTQVSAKYVTKSRMTPLVRKCDLYLFGGTDIACVRVVGVRCVQVQSSARSNSLKMIYQLTGHIFERSCKPLFP